MVVRNWLGDPCMFSAARQKTTNLPSTDPCRNSILSEATCLSLCCKTPWLAIKFAVRSLKASLHSHWRHMVSVAILQVYRASLNRLGLQAPLPENEGSLADCWVLFQRQGRHVAHHEHDNNKTQQRDSSLVRATALAIRPHAMGKLTAAT